VKWNKAPLWSDLADIMVDLKVGSPELEEANKLFLELSIKDRMLCKFKMRNIREDRIEGRHA
jgi:hypothetical protein